MKKGCLRLIVGTYGKCKLNQIIIAFIDFIPIKYLVTKLLSSNEIHQKDRPRCK